MKQVLTAPNAAEAHVALAALESAGIEGVIRDEFTGALPLGPVSRPSVWVRDEDYVEACQALGVSVDNTQLSESGSKSPSLRVLIAIIAALLVILWLQR